MGEAMTNAARQKAYRLRRKDEEVENVTRDVTDTVTDGPLRNAGTVTALRGRVTELEEEVARLKRELAEANGRAMPARWSQSIGSINVKAAKPDNDKQVTPHGMRCMCQWCQQQRRVAGWEGA